MSKKALLMMLLMAILAPWAANAQTTVEIGDGTSASYQTPIGTYYNYSITEQLYTADEIGMAGTINSVSFYWAFTEAKDFSIDVYMANVDAEDLSTGISLEDAYQVYSGMLFVTSEPGWVTINLSTPFVYNGTSNLLIGVNKTGGVTWFSGSTWRYTTVSNMARYSQNDNSTYDLSTTPEIITSNRPNIQMEITAGSAPVCEKPQIIEPISVYANYAVVNWMSGSGTYNVEYKKATDEEWIVRTTNYSYYGIGFPELEPNTTYNVRVQSVCSDGLSGWKTVNFTTLATIPLVENFDANSLPTGWTKYTGLLSNVMAGEALATTTSGWSFTSSNGVFDNHARVNLYGSNCKYWLVSPTLLMEDNVQLLFDMALTAYSGIVAEPATTGTDDKFVVLITTDGGITWDVLRQWDNDGSEYVLNDIACSATGEAVAIDLSSYAGENIAIAFYGESTESNADNNLHIDNISIATIPACAAPINLTVSYSGGPTAEVSWTSNAPAWNMKVNGYNVPGIITNPYTLTRLQLATTYTVEVQAVCGDGSTSDWVSTSFTTDFCLPQYTCELTYVLNDSYGDGWNGNAIQVVDAETEVVLATWTIGNGSTDTGTLALCDGRDIQFVWVKGSYPGETSWVIYDVNGEEITSGSGNSDMATGDVLDYYTMNCTTTNCKRPTNLAAAEIGPHTAMLSWTENGEATAWVVEYTDLIAGAVYTVETNSNPYTMVGLFAESEYSVRVRPVCSDFDNKWSEELSFVTDVACPAPTNLNATHVMANKATLTWEGYGTLYNVRYGIVSHGEVFAEQDFDDSSMGEWTTIDADGDGYDWMLGSSFMGTGYGHDGSYDMIFSQSYVNGTGALTPDNYLVSPQVTLGGTITFWACGHDANWAAEHFGVAVSTTGNTAPEDFTTIWESTMTAKGRGDANSTGMKNVKMNRSMTRGGNRSQGTWYQYTVDLSEYSGQGYVAIRHFNCTDMFVLDVDDIVIENASQMNWVERTVRNNTVAVSGLEPETEYLWQVQAVCGGDDGSSEWTNIANFTTGSFCDAPVELETTDISSNTATFNWLGSQRKYHVRYGIVDEESIPFETDFDDSSMGEWTTIDADGDGYDWTLGSECGGVYLTEGGSLAGTGHNASADLVTSGSYSNYTSAALTPDNYLVSPQVNLGGAITFWACAQDDNYAADHFGVAVSTTGSTDPTDFTTIWEATMTAKGGQGTWYRYTVDLSAFSGQGYVAIRHFNCTDMFMINVDDIVIEGPDQMNWTEVVVNNNTVAVTGLYPATLYKWQVRGIYSGCGNNNATEWSEASYFTTESVPTQTVALIRGANWFSTCLEITLDDLKDALVAALPNKKIAIASQNNGTLTYNRGRWTGNLETLDVTQMYMIQVAVNCEITLQGPAIIPSEHPITLNKGWNWIGFPGDHSVSVEEALAGFRPKNNDVIKGRTSFTKFTNGTWQGTLTTFEPGQGYQYGSGSNAPRILVFNTGRSDDNNTNITLENNFFQPVNDYANNMTMTAVVEIDDEELRSENHELAAFVGDECRGSVKLMYVESIDRYVAFLTVLGDKQEELYFQLTDGFASNLSSNAFTYAIDAITGTLDEPYIVHFRPTDVEENASANVKIYPNPSEGIFNIEGQNIKKVEVFDALGQPIYTMETENEFLKIDLTNRASGIYLIRIVTNDGIWSHQLMKR